MVGSKVVGFPLQGIPRNIFLASVIALSCAVVVLLIIICGLIWQRRRAVPSERIQGKEKVDFHGVKSSPDRQSNDEQASDPNTYMELKARLPNHKQSHVPTEYQSLQEVPMNPEYYNMVLQKEIGGKQNEKCMRKYDNPQIISSRTDMTTIGFWSRQFISQFTAVRL